MASAADLDGLVLLRQSISSNAPFIPTASADASATEVPLSQATYLRFPDRGVAVPIDNPTRFVSQDKPVDLRSIYFAWLNREVAIPEYNASATKLNEELAAAGGSGKVQNLGFIERLDLITWLEGASEESEYIKPLPSDKDAVAAGASTAATTGAVTSTAQSRSGRDPIILLSPSASSLLRLSNARSFLEDGKFVPTDGGGAMSNMLHVQRIIPSIDPNRPMRFILVEGPEAFKPEYWNRIVAVLTTGQTWQFKNYKWSDPNELFKHTLGIYVGWRGESAPDNIRNWGHRVLSTGIDRWRGEGHDASRFRDKEIVEQIWRAIEENMRYRGWKKDRAPSSI
ncbi:cell division control 73 [Fusarium pseudoanthophilum]|uniref:Cell division control 73 n=1 Tax=Fusarium pseudoanthophilum TaxID=48495 RepID=A0A8H5NP17_9HYPO|nr:cell division control 73 [Fusarium pseudoanthophilum]